MEVKPGYKQTEAGVIPEDWDVVRLSELGKFRNGINKSSAAFGHGYPFVNLMDVFGVSSIEANAELGLVDTNGMEQQTYDIQKGDVLFIRSSVKPSGVGLSAVVEKDLPKTVYSGFLIRFRDSGALGNGFKRHCFYEEGFRKRVIGASSVSANTNINQDNLKRLPLPLPPTRAEQEGIAEALSEIDELLGALETLTAKKQAIKQAAMQQLLTGKTRLPGFTGEWETKRLGDVASLFKGSGLSKADLTPDGKRRCIHYGELFTTYGERIIEVLNGTDREDALFRSVRNDVLMPTSAETPNGLATASCMLLSDIIIGGDILVIRALESLLNGEFLAYAVKANRNQVMQLVSGTTVFHLYGRNMAYFSFRAPSVAEQTAIVTVFSDMEAEIALLQRRRDKIRVIKQGMMQQLLTGRVRLVKPSQAKACA